MFHSTPRLTHINYLHVIFSSWIKHNVSCEYRAIQRARVGRKVKDRPQKSNIGR